jgi:P-type Ca2+ transporter type 2C
LQRENGTWGIIGDPTEGALLTLAGKGGIERDQWESKLPRVGEIPFSSERKRMSVICEVKTATDGFPNEKYLMFTKGSPELILATCDRIDAGTKSYSLTSEQRQIILAENDKMASNGLRVLGFAYRPLPEVPPDGEGEAVEQQLVWLGLVGMLDAPRPEVRDAVRECRAAGIRPIMITGVTN